MSQQTEGKVFGNPSSNWTPEERLAIIAKMGNKMIRLSLRGSTIPVDRDMICSLGNKIHDIASRSTEFLERNRQGFLVDDYWMDWMKRD